MADTKITALAAIGANPINVATFPIPMVDLLDNSMAASGTTKKVTVNQILGAGGTATLASATITGALTVDTSTLVVNPSGYADRVGIGTATPAAELHVIGGANFSDGTTTLRAVSSGNVAFLGTTTTDPLVLRVNNIEQYRIAQLGVFTWSNGAGGTRMTLNATGLGIANGNVILSTSGKGIDFSATSEGSGTMTSELLNDYEEGTFTPTIVGTTTAGTGTYSTQEGRYTKIGNQVSVHIFLYWSAHTGTGNLKLAGLPFQSSNNFHACSIGFWDNIAVTAANVPMAYVINSETNVSLLQMPSGGGAMVAIPMDTAGAFILSATYTV